MRICKWVKAVVLLFLTAGVGSIHAQSTSVSSPAVTLDGAAQLATGIGAVLSTGTLPTSGSAEPAYNAVSLSISFQPSNVWAPLVQPVSTQSNLIGSSQARRLAVSGEQSTMVWKPQTNTAKPDEASFSSSAPSYKPQVPAGAEDSTLAESGDTVESTVPSLPSVLGLQAVQGSVSCLDSAAGCAGVGMPAMSFTLPYVAHVPTRAATGLRPAIQGRLSTKQATANGTSPKNSRSPSTSGGGRRTPGAPGRPLDPLKPQR